MTHGPKALVRRLGGVMVMLVALGPAVVLTSTPAQAAYTPSARTVAAYEARVIWRMNKERARLRSGGILRPARCPDYFAERWAPYLARSGRFYHQSMYRILRTCRARVAAENLARGNVGADQMVYAWMRSPGHRRNVLDRRLTHVGVSAVYRYGRWVVVADFTRS